MKRKSVWANFEYKILLIVLGLFLVGIISITNAVAATPNDSESWLQQLFTGFGEDSAISQLTAFGLGIFAMMFVQIFDYDLLRRYWVYILGLSCVLIVIVFFTDAVNGTKGWIPIGSFSLQPSEFGKIALIVCASALLARYEKITSIRDALPALGVFGLLFGLIILQKDLGTGLVYLFIILGLLFIAGINYKYILGAIGGLIVIAIPAWFLMKGYQRDRLLTFINFSGSNSSDAAYQLSNSIPILGSGKLFGKGLFNESASIRLGYLPVSKSDFIFAVIGETFGFIGCLLVLVLFALLITRMWQIARNSRDRFGLYVTFGIMLMLMFHIYENVGMTMGLMPITGIPLPFVSYGGSSLIANLLAMGLVMSISMRRDRGIFSR